MWYLWYIFKKDNYITELRDIYDEIKPNDEDYFDEEHEEDFQKMMDYLKQ